MLLLKKLVLVTLMFIGGNNSTDGSFVYTGFKPAWILMKRNSAGASWSFS